MPDGFSALLVGEGNFSFAGACASLLWGHSEGALEDDEKVLQRVDALCTHLLLPPAEASETLIVATSFDERDELLEKYPECEGIFLRLESHPEHVSLMHGVNAWALEDSFPLSLSEKKFDRVVWNHPHLGIEDLRLHRFLMSHFFHSARNALAVSGILVVSLVDGQAERWRLVEEAQKQGMKLLSVRPFREEDFPGYVCKRNLTGRSFKNVHTQRHTRSSMPSWRFAFCREEDLNEARAAVSSIEALTLKGPPESADSESRTTVLQGSADRSSSPQALPSSPQGESEERVASAATAPAEGPRLSEGGSTAQGPGERRVLRVDAGTAPGCGRKKERAARRAQQKKKKEQEGDGVVLGRDGDRAGAERDAEKGGKTPIEKEEFDEFQCSFCGRLFPSLQGAKTHIRQVHELGKYGDWESSRGKGKGKEGFSEGGEGGLPCRVCGKRCADEEARWQHETAKHGRHAAAYAGQLLVPTSEEGPACSSSARSSGGLGEPPAAANLGGEEDEGAAGASSISVGRGESEGFEGSVGTVTVQGRLVRGFKLPFKESVAGPPSEQTGAEVRFHACEVCGQAVPDVWGMSQHLESLKPLVGLNARCERCDRRFIELRALQQHLNFCFLKPPVSEEPDDKTT
uniref:C2H2-type domain-containing protein n=1 Tax=Chromera velia CCMP2878 TaxID=1169474 RepID=A0A0G4FQG7_9ALVE|eukprot:Cvel_444.t1-p1 / transcript=Cvel_444.t1 / gene=Cvel_444 / organism=Chromera_velia_CCMP2878 / gene_product=UPF0617 protein C1919.13c, putative / transcript_product=UPF0617 protein C1919.13c, putative / location=Cvel_scaffold14:110371-115842(+) / protein_length=630 / sequence_SO=supercontig / SO=protein_coding / is_pseudo=false